MFPIPEMLEIKSFQFKWFVNDIWVFEFKVNGISLLKSQKSMHTVEIEFMLLSPSQRREAPFWA